MSGLISDFGAVAPWDWSKCPDYWGGLISGVISVPEWSHFQVKGLW